MRTYHSEYRKGFNRGYADQELYVKPRCGSYHSDAYKDGYEDGWDCAVGKTNRGDFFRIAVKA